jgi:small subunit ribosomal protein S30e
LTAYLSRRIVQRKASQRVSYEGLKIINLAPNLAVTRDRDLNNAEAAETLIGDCISWPNFHTRFLDSLSTLHHTPTSTSWGKVGYFSIRLKLVTYPRLVHGSLARAGKVKSQTPKVEPQEKKKTPKGRAKKRILYNRRYVFTFLTAKYHLSSCRFVNVTTLPGGKRRM